MTLQMALILIAIIVVAGVYFYSRRDGPRSGDMKPGKREADRPARRDTYIEPTLGAAGSLYLDPELGDRAAEMNDSADRQPASSMRVDEEEDQGSIEFSIAPESVSGATLESNAPEDVVADEEIPVAEDTRADRPAENDRIDQNIADTVPTVDEAVDEMIPASRDQNAVEGGAGDGAEDEPVENGEPETGAGDHQDIPILESRVDSTGQAEFGARPVEPEGEATGESRVSEENEPAMEEPVMIAGDPVEAGQDPGDTDSREAASAPPPAYVVNDGDQDNDLDDKPSIKELVGSMNPIQKLRGSIRHQLDIVKAEREGTEPPAGKSTGKKKEKKKFGDGMKWWKSDGKKDRAPAADMRARDRELTPHTEPDTGQWDEEENRVPLDRDAPVFSEEAADPAVEPDTPEQEPVASSPVDVDLTPADGFDKLSQIDYYVKLNGDRDVSRESVLAIYREGAAELSKKHSIYGLRMPDKVWSDLENEPEESRFGDLVITLQLVDQEGPVNENDMTKFSSLVMKLSESTGRGFAFMAPIENAHKQALAIDRFRQRFDAIFVVNIVPMEGEEMFEGPVIDRCATQIGLTADDNGFYGRYKPMGKKRVCLYSLANYSDTGEFDMENLRAVRTRGVTFFTRPTINRSPGAVFSEMVDAARAFASRIKGEVIAPGFDDLSNEDVEKIRQSIDTVAKDMESHGINPGSDEAARLF